MKKLREIYTEEYEYILNLMKENGVEITEENQKIISRFARTRAEIKREIAILIQDNKSKQII